MNIRRWATSAQCSPAVIVLGMAVLLGILVAVYRALIIHVIIMTALGCAGLLVVAGAVAWFVHHIRHAHRGAWPAHTHQTKVEPVSSGPGKIPDVMPARVPVATPESSIAEDADKLARDTTHIIIKDGKLTAINRPEG